MTTRDGCPQDMRRDTDGNCKSNWYLKRKTALKHVDTTIQRLRTMDLPLYSKELHLFGSVAKGKEKPGDIDLILKYEINILDDIARKAWDDILFRYAGLQDTYKYYSPERIANKLLTKNLKGVHILFTNQPVKETLAWFRKDPAKGKMVINRIWVNKKQKTYPKKYSPIQPYLTFVKQSKSSLFSEIEKIEKKPFSELLKDTFDKRVVDDIIKHFKREEK